MIRIRCCFYFSLFGGNNVGLLSLGSGWGSGLCWGRGLVGVGGCFIFLYNSSTDVDSIVVWPEGIKVSVLNDAGADGLGFEGGCDLFFFHTFCTGRNLFILI
jgi:hypothetical protein